MFSYLQKGLCAALFKLQGLEYRNSSKFFIDIFSKKQSTYPV